MKLPLYQIDAFTRGMFGGNPAAVVLLDEWLPDETLQAIAAENNLAETAFVIPRPEVSPLRWLTPGLEVGLVWPCHARHCVRSPSAPLPIVGPDKVQYPKRKPDGCP